MAQSKNSLQTAPNCQLGFQFYFWPSAEIVVVFSITHFKCSKLRTERIQSVRLLAVNALNETCVLAIQLKRRRGLDVDSKVLPNPR